jgi:hypothetical protein
VGERTVPTFPDCDEDLPRILSGSGTGCCDLVKVAGRDLRQREACRRIVRLRGSPHPLCSDPASAPVPCFLAGLVCEAAASSSPDLVCERSTAESFLWTLAGANGEEQGAAGRGRHYSHPPSDGVRGRSERPGPRRDLARRALPQQGVDNDIGNWDMSFTRCNLTRAFGSTVPQFVTPLGSVVFGDEIARRAGPVSPGCDDIVIGVQSTSRWAVGSFGGVCWLAVPRWRRTRRRSLLRGSISSMGLDYRPPRGRHRAAPAFLPSWSAPPPPAPPDPWMRHGGGT